MNREENEQLKIIHKYRERINGPYRQTIEYEKITKQMKQRKKLIIVAKCLHFEYRITRFG